MIGHPFNPPHLIPLVEVVGGERTAPAAIEQAMAFYAAIGKRPIHIRREVPGHIANRLQAALWREAVHLVASGVASVADVDAAISEGPGLRWALMGPHLTFHLAGGTGGMPHFLNQLGPPLESWWGDLGAPRLTPEVREALIDGVADEAGGRGIDDLAAARDKFLRRSAGAEEGRMTARGCHCEQGLSLRAKRSNLAPSVHSRRDCPRRPCGPPRNDKPGVNHRWRTRRSWAARAMSSPT